MFLYWREKKVAPDDCPELFPGTRQALRDLCEKPNAGIHRAAEGRPVE